MSRPGRVAVVCEGDPRDPAEWSGTPYGILQGLRACGVETLPLRGALTGRCAALTRDVLALLSTRPVFPRPGRVGDELRRARRVASSTAAYGRVGSLLAAIGLLRAGHVDGVVQIGSSFALRHPRIVTFEDMTVRQAVEEGQRPWVDLPSRTVRMRVERQRRAYEKAVAVLTATPWAARSVTADYGVPRAKVQAIGLGWNHGPAAGSPRVGKRWDVPHFLFVGHDWERKNGAAVISAFRRVRVAVPEATLDLVGGHPRIDEPGVTGHGPLRLSDAGESTRLDALFDRSTCLVMPSRFEAAGIVYVEAGAWGVPSIGTLRGGAADMIGDGGRVVDPDDPDGLVAAMRELARPEIARHLGGLASARSALFTWTEVSRRVLAHMGLGGGLPVTDPWPSP